MNPPWGHKIWQWIHKAKLESEAGLTVVCLIPTSTDTIWWHEVVAKRATQVQFIRGRLRFVRDDGHTGPAPKGCALVIFTPWHRGKPHYLVWSPEDGKQET